MSYNARSSERILRHICENVETAGALRNHRKESRVERGPFGLGVMNMDIDAEWARDQQNKMIYIPEGRFCPYCGENLANVLIQKNEEYNANGVKGRANV
jgi:hypothetical protein